MALDHEVIIRWLGALGFERLLAAAFLGILAVSALYIFKQRVLSPLGKVPGPWLASVSPLWRLYYVARGDWHDTVIKLHCKYGQFVRIAPNELSTTSPSAIRIAYSHSGSPWVKDEWYETWWADKIQHPTFAETNVHRHRSQRRRVSKLYSMSYVLGLQCYTDRVLDRFFQQMRSLQEKPIDIAKWTQYFAFDVIGELGFGDWFGNVDAATDQEHLGHWVFLTLTGHAVLGWTWLRALVINTSPVQWLLNKSLYKYTREKMSSNPLGEVLTRIIAKLGNPTTDQHDNMVRFIKTMKNPDGSEVHERQKMIEIANLILAGGDTTAISLRAIIYYVCSHPHVCAKLQQEIDNATRSNKLSPIVTFQEAQELSYFQLVVKEALRLYPAVGYQLPRIAPPGGANIDGVYIPAGTIMGTNGWALHRNAGIYGSDCEEFRPERWLKKTTASDKAKLMEECLGSFGFGSRTCLGKNLAMMEISRLIPTLFRDFNVEICYPQNPWIITTGWFAFSSEFFVRVSARNGTSNDLGSKQA